MKRILSGIVLLHSVLSAQVPTVTLDQAVQEALASNLDLAAERYNISVAQARQITAALRPNPVLTVTTQTLNLLGTRYRPTSPAGPNQMNMHTDFVFERGAKRENRITLANADRSLTEFGVRDLSRRLILEVDSVFVDVLQAKSNLALAQDNLRSLQGIVEVNQAKVNAGEIASVELDRSRVAALQYQGAVDRAALEVTQAKFRLQLLMGRTAPSELFDVTGELRRGAVLDRPEEIRARALGQRPDVQGLHQSQARSQADLRLQLSNGKVDFTAGTEYSYQRAYGFGGSSLGFSFSAPIPVFNKNQGEIARAQREIEQAGARLKAIEAEVSAEVDAAYRQYFTFQQLLIGIENNLLKTSQNVRDVTEYSYRRGEASLVEFLDAQRAFNDSMQSYNEARANFARSLYLMDAVSGAAAAP